MADFYEILERVGFTLYNYAAWFMPVTRFGSYTRVRPALKESRPHVRRDVAEHYGIDEMDDLGKALFVKQKVTEEEALLIDTSPGREENFFFAIEVSPASLEERDRVIGKLMVFGAENNWGSLKIMTDEHDEKNPRFIVEFFSKDFHRTLERVRSVFQHCNPEIRTLLSAY
jgi:hypothetical protein